MEAPRLPVLQKIGSFFRRQIGAETGLRGRHLCGLCGEPTDPGRRQWSPSRQRYIDDECIPAYIRNLGAVAVREWLEGTFGKRRI
jgi:hypothetical protein